MIKHLWNFIKYIILNLFLKIFSNLQNWKTNPHLTSKESGSDSGCTGESDSLGHSWGTESQASLSLFIQVSSVQFLIVGTANLLSCMCAKLLQLCPTLWACGLWLARPLCPWDPPGWSGLPCLLPGLSSWLGDWTCISYASCIGGRHLGSPICYTSFAINHISMRSTLKKILDGVFLLPVVISIGKRMKYCWNFETRPLT